jgi:phosphatidylglycerol:prolipoprotein diacylglycerol transferase
MLPYLFKIGDFPIRSFGLMVLLGVLAGAWWLGKTTRRIGLTDGDPVGELMTRAILWGFLGARLMYIAVHPDVYRDVISLVAVWEGGLVSYGGFMGGCFGVWMFCRKRNIPLTRGGDAVLPCLLLGQVLGRIGCLLVGDDHGAPFDGAWAVTFQPREGSLIPPELMGVPLHPSQLYLSFMNLVLFAGSSWIFFKHRLYDGRVSAFVLMGYAVGRFLVEFTRGDDAARGIYDAAGFSLSTAQWISVAIFINGAIVWLRQRKRPQAQVALA